MKQLFKTFLKRQFRSGGFITAIVLFGGMMAFFPSAFGAASVQTAGAMLGTGISFAIVLGWGTTFSSIRNSAIMKGIISSNITKTQFMIVALTSSLLMSMVASIVILGLMLIFIAVGEIEGWTGAVGIPGLPLNPRAEIMEPGELIASFHWGKIIGGILLSTMSAVGVALLIGNILSNPIHITTASWIYGVSMFFFGGAGAPITLIRGIGEGEGADILAVFRYIGYALPNSYSNFFLADAFSEGNVDLVAQIPPIDSAINLSIPFAYAVPMYSIAMWYYYK